MFWCFLRVSSEQTSPQSKYPSDLSKCLFQQVFPPILFQSSGISSKIPIQIGNLFENTKRCQAIVPNPNQHSLFTISSLFRFATSTVQSKRRLITMTLFCIQKAESDIERLLLDVHDSTSYLIDNVRQDTTAKQTMNDLMDLQDEPYAVMRLLKQSQLQSTTTTGSNSPSTSTAVAPNPQLSPQIITGSSDNNPHTSLRNDAQTSNGSCPKLRITLLVLPFGSYSRSYHLTVTQRTGISGSDYSKS